MAVFVENDGAAIKTLTANLRKTRLADRAEILPVTVEKAIKGLKADKKTFDIIFMDPPYGRDYINPTLTWLAEAEILADNGVIIVEMPVREEVPASDSYTKQKEKTYGDTRFVWYISI
jgi:16S rRNA (guanine(966)-N(2))-methyltransferase RsmD